MQLGRIDRVLEGLAARHEHHGDLLAVGRLELGVAGDVDFDELESVPFPLPFEQLLGHIAQVAARGRVDAHLDAHDAVA